MPITLTRDQEELLESLPVEYDRDDPDHVALARSGLVVISTNEDTDSGAYFEFLIRPDQVAADERRMGVDTESMAWAARQGAVQDAMPPEGLPEGSLRVWWLNNLIKGKNRAVVVYVRDTQEAMCVMTALSDLELAMGDTTEWNASGLEVWKGGTWSEWTNSAGRDIVDIRYDLNRMAS